MAEHPIVFLHLSDIHICNEKDISDKHINKIVDSLRSYKTDFNKIIIIISGDITQSGELIQFKNAGKLMGSLITQLKTTFSCGYEVIVVPGNHDVSHGTNILDIENLKSENYSEIEMVEYKKLKNFYTFSKFNKCFINSEIYSCKRIVEIDGFKIQFNLVNNAIFSTRDQYKGLLYIPDDSIKNLKNEKDADFIATVMHHAPDFYRDSIKNDIEDKLIRNSNILFHGHEHYNYDKNVSFSNSKNTIIQSCGCLCDKGDWRIGSYFVGLLYPVTRTYSYHKFSWNPKEKQYEHNNIASSIMEHNSSGLQITEDFNNFIHEEPSEYYIFPTIMCQEEKKDLDEYKIESFDKLREELLKRNYSMINGASNIGKTSLLKRLFLSFVQDYYVIYGSADKISEKSKNKKQNIKKLIESLFHDVYGNDESKYQSFEQADKKDCVFIFDDFENIDGINLNDFLDALDHQFGTIILSSSRVVDFDPQNISLGDKGGIAKFEIKAPVGRKRRELIESVVKAKIKDKSTDEISDIVEQVDRLIKTQLSIIPPEPYYIIQITENFMNNVGEAVYKTTNPFSKVFEANLTNRLDYALRTNNQIKGLTVDLMYVLLSKIAYYIHFNKAYPIKRSEIDKIINEYNSEYGYSFETEDIICVAKTAKLINHTINSRESFRFRNKSFLAYFVAREIVNKKDYNAMYDVINKACFNICTDILLFTIYLTDEIIVIEDILKFISNVVSSNEFWDELSIPDNIPVFLQKNKTLLSSDTTVNKEEEKKELQKNEEITEESMLTEFTIKDIYDWDEANIEKFNNQLIRMTSLLQIISRCLPCFDHLLKKSEKITLIETIYTLPNRIFNFWSKFIDDNYNDIIGEIKTHPYFTNRKTKLREHEIEEKAKAAFAVYSMDLLLNLYYIPALNATGSNTFQFLSNKNFFDYESSITYQIENLMFSDQNHKDSGFVANALKLKEEANEMISSYLLNRIVKHGLITRKDSRENIDKLESKFFPQSKKAFLIERRKNSKK